jgi:biopolymer transport protein ExbD
MRSAPRAPLPFHFRKQADRIRPPIPTLVLPDIVLTLLLFFVIMTVFHEPEPLVQTALPSAEAVERIESPRLVARVYIGPEALGDGRYGEAVVQIDDALVRDLAEIGAILHRRVREEPRLVVALRVDADVEAGLVYDVQRELRRAGALRVSYAAVAEDPATGR